MEHLVNMTKDLWERYERGDRMSLSQVRALLRQTEAALPYLQNRSYALGTLLASDAILMLSRLRGTEAILAREASPG